MMLLDHLRAAAERATWRILAGDMLAAGDGDAPPAPPPLTLAELHALAAEAAVLDRLAGLTASLGSPREAARALFDRGTPCAGLYATETPETASQAPGKGRPCSTHQRANQRPVFRPFHQDLRRRTDDKEDHQDLRRRPRPSGRGGRQLEGVRFRSLDLEKRHSHNLRVD